MHQFASQVPQALDHMIDILGQAFTLLPDTLQFDKYRGAEGAFLSLKWWFIQWADVFSKGSSYTNPCNDSKRGPIDAKNTQGSTNIFIEAS